MYMFKYIVLCYYEMIVIKIVNSSFPELAVSKLMKRKIENISLFLSNMFSEKNVKTFSLIMYYLLSSFILYKIDKMCLYITLKREE